MSRGFLLVSPVSLTKLCSFLYGLKDLFTSDPDAKYQLAKFGHAQKAKFRDVGFKSDTAVLTFTFRFLSSLLFSLFLPHFFFSYWAFSRFHFGGKSFNESF